MIEGVSKAIYALLVGDSYIQSTLSKYPPNASVQSPAIFSGIAPPGAKMPYMLVNYPSSVREDTLATDRSVVTLDTYLKSDSQLPAFQMEVRVDHLMNHGISPSGIPVLGIFPETSSVITEGKTEGRMVQHLHQRFLVRYGRGDIYEEA